MRKQSVLLLGSYGQTNLGDDLLMYNYLWFLRSKGFKRIFVNASIPSNIPPVIRREFPELIVLKTYETTPLGWVKTLAKVSCVVYGGGTIFKELYGSTGRKKYAVISRILVFNYVARIMGLRVYHLHIGIGVLKTWLGRVITRLALGVAELSIFRDRQSYIMARDKLNVPGANICLATDGLFLNPVWQSVWHESDIKAPNGKPVVGVNFLADIPDWIDREKYIATIRTFVKSLLERENFVFLIPFQHSFNPNNDYDFMKREIVPHISEFKNFRLIKSLPIDEAIDAFKELDVFVGMRFHSLLLAASAKTRFLAVAYDTKCWRFVQSHKYPHGVRLEDADEATLQQAYNLLLNDYDSLPAELQRITEHEQKKGAQCIDRVRF